MLDWIQASKSFGLRKIRAQMMDMVFTTFGARAFTARARACFSAKALEPTTSAAFFGQRTIRLLIFLLSLTHDQVFILPELAAKKVLKIAKPCSFFFN